MKPVHIACIAIFIIGVAGIGPATAELTTVAKGRVVFVGEEGLTFTDEGGPVPAGTVLEWYAPGDTPGIASPGTTYSCQGPGNEYIFPAIFLTHTGNWYCVNRTFSPPTYYHVVNVQCPKIDVKIFNADTGEDLTNEQVVKKNTYLAIRIDSNLYWGFNSRPNYVPGDPTGIRVVIIDPEGDVHLALYNDDTVTPMTTCNLTNLVPTSSRYFLPSTSTIVTSIIPNWALDLPAYEMGVYTFYAEVNTNGITNNLGTISGITKSGVKTLGVIEDFVNIDVDNDTISPDEDVTVTISGRPDEYYVLWAMGTNAISTPNTAPYIRPGQEGVYLSDTVRGGNAGLYQFIEGKPVFRDVCQADSMIWRPYYAMVKLPGSGNRTVTFSTDETTRNQTYAIRTDHIPYRNATKNPAMTYVADHPMNATVLVTVGEIVNNTDFRANITYGVAPVAIAFTDLSTGTPTGTPSSWNWDFGDGTTSTEQNPVHQYTSAGNYTVCLTAEGCGDCCAKPAYIRIAPVLFGDANNDNQVNQVDTLRVLKEVVGLTPLPEAGDVFTQTDVHTNNVIDIGDAMFIAQYNVGLRGQWFELAA